MSEPDVFVDGAVANCWSDPLVGLQVQEFWKYVTEFHETVEKKAVDAAGFVDVAEYLCEWSRNLLNRTFGRTTPTELEQISAMFRETAQKIEKWAAQYKFNDAQGKKVQAYASHIQQRTGFNMVSPVQRS